MKKQIAIALLLMVYAAALTAQNEFKPGGTGIGTVFFNYKYDLTKDVTKKSSFNLDRAYLGYKYDFSPTISGRVLFDVGYDANTKAYTAFAKNAYVDWTITPHVRLTAGLIPLHHFDLMEKAWGYRYIIKPFADEYGMGTTADLGFNLELPINDVFTFDAYVINGEGFKSLQDDFGMHKFGASATVKPVEGLSFRLHYDLNPNKYYPDETTVERDTTTISVFSAFVGYEVKDKFRVGVDYNMMNNATEYRKPSKDHNLSGFSVFGTYIFNPKYEIFARYDYLKSNTLEGENMHWSTKDGSLVMAGIQYRPIKNVNFALNYRTWLYKDKNIDGIPGDDLNNPAGIYLNLGMFF
ncbi:MAG: hypothetical protein ACM3PX_05900 [Omnitrophica WOR_2 bacterium]|jgi:hypothetical protein